MNLRLLTVSAVAAGALSGLAGPASAYEVCLVLNGSWTCPSELFPLCLSSGGRDICVTDPFGPLTVVWDLPLLCVTVGANDACITDGGTN